MKDGGRAAPASHGPDRAGRPPGGRGPGDRWPGSVLAGATLLSVAALLAPVGAGAQAPAGEPPDGAEAPEMADAPEAYRLGPTATHLTWAEGSGPTPDDGTLLGLDVERLLDSFLAMRLGLAHGSGSIAGDGQEEDVGAYMVDLSLVVRAPLSGLARAGVVPYAAGGIGTVVHDPAADSLSTASQNTLSYGLGVDFRALDRFGARLEWRRHEVNLENVFDPVDRTGRPRAANRFQASLYWAF